MRHLICIIFYIPSRFWTRLKIEPLPVHVPRWSVSLLIFGSRARLAIEGVVYDLSLGPRPESCWQCAMQRMLSLRQWHEHPGGRPASPASPAQRVESGLAKPRYGSAASVCRRTAEPSLTGQKTKRPSLPHLPHVSLKAKMQQQSFRRLRE